MDYNYNYTYDPNDTATNVAIAGMLFLFIIIVVLVSYAIEAFLLSRIFKKAGVPQWAAWVPIYNVWKFLQLGNQQGFWAVLMPIPFVGIVAWIFMYIAAYHIGKKLGKEDWFILFAIFLPIVWMIWLGFDDSKWPAAKAKKKPARRKKSA